MSSENLNPEVSRNAPEDQRILIDRIEAQLGEQKDLAAAKLLIAAVLEAFRESDDE